MTINQSIKMIYEYPKHVDSLGNLATHSALSRPTVLASSSCPFCWWLAQSSPGVNWIVFWWLSSNSDSWPGLPMPAPSQVSCTDFLSLSSATNLDSKLADAHLFFLFLLLLLPLLQLLQLQMQFQHQVEAVVVEPCCRAPGFVMVCLDLELWCGEVCQAKQGRGQLCVINVPGFRPRTMSRALRPKGQCDSPFKVLLWKQSIAKVIYC